MIFWNFGGFWSFFILLNPPPPNDLPPPLVVVSLAWTISPEQDQTWLAKKMWHMDQSPVRLLISVSSQQRIRHFWVQDQVSELVLFNPQNQDWNWYWNHWVFRTETGISSRIVENFWTFRALFHMLVLTKIYNITIWTLWVFLDIIESMKICYLF